jgi:uncharacterized protein
VIVAILCVSGGAIFKRDQEFCLLPIIRIVMQDAELCMTSKEFLMALSIRDLWATSARVFPGISKSSLILRTRFVGAGLKSRPWIERIISSPPSSALGRIYAERPSLLGVLVWPFQTAALDSDERLQRLVEHYEEVDALGPRFNFSSAQSLVLNDLGEIAEGVRIVLDQPEWFAREGAFVLNLFIENFRAFSMAFSLHRNAANDLEAVIGGLQGRSREGILEEYKVLTKAFFGLRPRDLLIENFRCLCGIWKVKSILAVSDAGHIHRHSYFGKKETPAQSYDVAWADRGGTKLNDILYTLPIETVRQEMEDIKANKRSMYKKRYEFLDTLEGSIQKNIDNLVPITLKDL